MLWAGTVGAELYVQRMSLVVMLAGVVIYFWGFQVLRLVLVSLVLVMACANVQYSIHQP